MAQQFCLANPAAVVAAAKCECRKPVTPTLVQIRHYGRRNITPAKETEFHAKVLKYWKEHPPTPEQLNELRS